jgi:uncharacterized protein (TIGR00661 family)
MKILYAIQGTGNGHVSRAFEVIPALLRHGEVDLLISGQQCDIQLPWPVKYRYHGMGFVFGQKGGVDFKATLKMLNLNKFLNEIRNVPVEDYDLIINDFEPVTAYACLVKRVKAIGLSHQAAVMRANAPRPVSPDIWGALVMQLYAPVSHSYGFHFQAYDERTFTPVIRKEIRESKPVTGNHYTVYLPSYGDSIIIDYFNQFPEYQFEVFSKHSKTTYHSQNIVIQPVNKEKFSQSLIHSQGVICNAGFETPAEALFLNKKLCVIPMSGQYEQQCNAFSLEKMGVAVLPSLNSQSWKTLATWLVKGAPVQVNYPNNLYQIIDQIVAYHAPHIDTLPNFSMPTVMRMG